MLAVHELVAVQVAVLWLATAVGAMLVLRKRSAARDSDHDPPKRLIPVETVRTDRATASNLRRRATDWQWGPTACSLSGLAKRPSPPP